MARPLFCEPDLALPGLVGSLRRAAHSEKASLSEIIRVEELREVFRRRTLEILQAVPLHRRVSQEEVHTSPVILREITGAVGNAPVAAQDHGRWA